MNDYPTARTKWSYAIHMFMQKCKERGLCAFQNSNSSGSNNQKVLKFLINARRQIVAFLTNFGIFTEFRIRSVQRDFVFRDNNFIVTSSCKLVGVGVTDKAKFIEHIASPDFRFKRALGGRRYSTMLNSAMFVHLDIGADVRLTYEIRCPMLPEATFRNRVVSDKDFRRFVANSIWLPAVRTVRFPKARRPSLF
jgi:hypothetical protein